MDWLTALSGCRANRSTGYSTDSLGSGPVRGRQVEPIMRAVGRQAGDVPRVRADAWAERIRGLSGGEGLKVPE